VGRKIKTREVNSRSEFFRLDSMKTSEKYNASGYLDLTAYYAIKCIERSNAKKIPNKKRKIKRVRNNGK